MADQQTPESGKNLQDVLVRELRNAVAAQIEAGADPGKVTADLTERVRRLRRLRQESQDGPPEK